MKSFEKKTVMQPVEVTVARQIEAELEHYLGAAVVLVPSGDQGLTALHRSPGPTQSRPMWRIAHNGIRGSLTDLLAGVDHALLVAREDVDAILSGQTWLTDGRDE